MQKEYIDKWQHEEPGQTVTPCKYCHGTGMVISEGRGHTCYDCGYYVEDKDDDGNTAESA